MIHIYVTCFIIWLGCIHMKIKLLCCEISYVKKNYKREQKKSLLKSFCIIKVKTVHRSISKYLNLYCTGSVVLRCSIEKLFEKFCKTQKKTATLLSLIGKVAD